MNRRRELMLIMAAALSFVIGCSNETLEPIEFERNAWSYRDRDGTHLVTEHYDIYTTVADDYLIESFPEFIEQAHTFYTEFVPFQDPVDPEDAEAAEEAVAAEPLPRLQTYLFAQRSEWTDFTRRRNAPSRAESLLRIRRGGYAQGDTAAIQFVTNSVTFPLLAHEGFHQYLSTRVNPRVPAWLNEGLAVCSEGFRRVGSYYTFDPLFNPARRNALARPMAEGRMIPLRVLISIHPSDVLERQSAAIGTYYAQVWALINFLRDGEEGIYRERYDRMIVALRAPDLERHARAAYLGEAGAYNYGEYLFRAFFGDDLSAIEAEYLSYIRDTLIGG